MVQQEKKVKNTAMATKEERAQIKKNVTKVDPDDDDTNVHRLVQDENAKTILLNFPLEVSTIARLHRQLWALLVALTFLPRHLRFMWWHTRVARRVCVSDLLPRAR